MKAVILAGGLGTRLKPISGDMPKCLMPVMGRPMLTMVINQINKCSITDITLALGYKAEAFLEQFGHMKYKIESEPLGTGGAIKNCMEGDEPILVSNGDTVCPIDYQDMLKNHIPPLSVAVTQKNGHMQSAGIYIINPELFTDAPEGAFSFEEFIQNKRKKFYTVDWFTDYGTPEKYADAPKEWI